MPRVHRTVVDLEPVEVFHRIEHLSAVVGERAGLAVRSWPDDCREGATFEVEQDGEVVPYVLTTVEAPTLLVCQGQDDEWDVGHCLVIAPAVGGGSELVWTTTSRQERAGVDRLGHVVLRQLTIASGTPFLAA